MRRRCDHSRLQRIRAAAFAAVVLPAVLFLGISLGSGTAAAQIGTVLIAARQDRSDGIVEYVKTPQPAGAQGFIYLRAANPIATLIVIPGGAGRLNLDGEDDPEWSGNFAARIRFDLVRAGVSVALVDAPIGEPDLPKFRISPQQAKDIEHVAAYARDIAPVPVFILGMSRGSVSAANAASHDGYASGLILVSSVTLPNRYSPTVVYNTDLKAIHSPVLLIHHKEDLCATTPVDSIPPLANLLKRNTSVDVRIFQGGKLPEGDACESRSPHGYYGIEPQVVNTIVGWMKTHGAAPGAGK